MNENRNVIKFFSEAKASNAKVVDISEPTQSDLFERTAPAFIAGVFAFIAGWGFAQFAVDKGWWIFNGANKVYSALMIGGGSFVFVFTAVYVFTLLSGGVRYYTEFDQGKPPRQSAAGALIRTARDNQRRRLSPSMRPLLVTLARHYNEVGTMAVNPWETGDYFSDFDDSRRDCINKVRNYMVLIGAAERLEGGVVSLTGWGEEQLPKWAAGDFADVIELTESPHPEEG